MILSLEDAWTWYNAVRTLAYDVRQLAGLWDHPDLDAALGLDNRLRHRTREQFLDMATTILDDLDDLAILVLFSVFEATVRAQAAADVDEEAASIRHVAVLEAVNDLKESIKNGSFAKVTRAFKSMDADLTAQVDQIRKFRNWVAHGRREVPENNVVPRDAFARFGRYLALLAAISPSKDAPPSAFTSETPAEDPPGS